MDNRTAEQVSAQNSKNASVTKMTPAEKAAKNPKSMRLAIQAHCYHTCHGVDEYNSNKTKRDIKNCSNTNCHLWPVRGWRNL